jgi:hypothetical protein
MLNYSNDENNFYVCKKKLLSIGNHISFSVCTMGAILDVISVLVFIHLIHTNPNLKNLKSFKFLLSKSIAECIHCSTHLFVQITECVTVCSFSYSYLLQIIRFIFLNYMALICAMISILAEIFANLNRLFTMTTTKYKKYSTYFNFRYIMTSIICVPALLYTFKFFDTAIIASFEPETNRTYYQIRELNRPIFEYMRFTQSFVRDVICVLIMLVVNILILYNFNAPSERNKVGNNQKVQIFTAKQLRASHHNLSIEANKKENNLTIMLVVMGFICMLGHVPIFIKYIPSETIRTYVDSNQWFLIWVEDFFYFSISINFFVYLIFDHYFRKSFWAIFCRIFSIWFH